MFGQKENKDSKKKNESDLTTSVTSVLIIQNESF